MTRVDDSPVPDYPALLRLDGRGFVLLGAGQGIGRQAAHALHAAGASVFCVDVDSELAKDIAAEVDGVAWAADATSRDMMGGLFAAAGDALGCIHGVVDIIGMAQYADLLDIDDQQWNWHFDIVLRHALLAVQYGGRLMSSTGGGVFVFVASVSGMTSAPRHSAYGAAKAALMSLVRTSAVELGPSRVRVNAVAPGVVWTPRVSAHLGDEGRSEQSENAPLRDVATPADVAASILFLASDLSAYVSGHTLVVDGGVSAKFPYPMHL